MNLLHEVEKGGKIPGLEEISNSLRKCYILENPGILPPFLKIGASLIFKIKRKKK